MIDKTALARELATIFTSELYGYCTKGKPDGCACVYCRTRGTFEEILLAAFARLEADWQQEREKMERIFEAVVHTYESDDAMVPEDLKEASFVRRARKFRAEREAAIRAEQAQWQPIETAPKEVSRSNAVDLWMQVYASPLSFGLSDAFRVPECWRRADNTTDWAHTGPWVHRDRGEERELQARYITHWRPVPPAPGSVPTAATPPAREIEKA